MKKVSVVRANIKPFPAKNSNMKHCQGDQEKNKEICITDTECMVESQAQYIENLQQQIFVLENEIGYLTYLHESNKQHPSMVAEGEKMVKKLAECHNEIKSMKVELRRKQTTIDMIRSERDRIQRYKEELEEKFRKEKCKLLEEVITTRKEKESQQDRNTEVEQQLQEQKQNERNMQEDLDNMRVEMEQIKIEYSIPVLSMLGNLSERAEEKVRDKELISNLLKEKEKLQKDLFEMKMIEEAKPSDKSTEAIKELKEKIEELDELYEASKRCADHERLLRERLSEENNALIKRHAELEAELAEIRAQMREEQSLRASLEKVHLNTVLEASEAKNRDKSLKDEISHLNDLLKEECERSYSLALQLSDEQRFKSREEEKYSHLSQRFEQREDQIKIRENENIELMRDNTYLKDQVLHLKEQLKSRDEEVSNLKLKVQEMQVSVEEFIQSTQAANRLAGERWKQLGQLAQGITALTSIVEPES